MTHHAIKTDEKMKRFNKIIGQLNGIKEMIERDRDCPEILLQISSVRAALAKISLMMTEDHLDHCITTSFQKGKGKESVASLVKVLKQAFK